MTTGSWEQGAGANILQGQPFLWELGMELHKALSYPWSPVISENVPDKGTLLPLQGEMGRMYSPALPPSHPTSFLITLVDEE